MSVFLISPSRITLTHLSHKIFCILSKQNMKQCEKYEHQRNIWTVRYMRNLKRLLSLQNLFIDAYLVDPLFICLIIPVEVGTLALLSDPAPIWSVLIWMVQNIRFNFLNNFFVLSPTTIQKEVQKTYIRHSNFKRNHWTIFSST